MLFINILLIVLVHLVIIWCCAGSIYQSLKQLRLKIGFMKISKNKKYNWVKSNSELKDAKEAYDISAVLMEVIVFSSIWATSYFVSIKIY